MDEIPDIKLPEPTELPTLDVTGSPAVPAQDIPEAPTVHPAWAELPAVDVPPLPDWPDMPDLQSISADLPDLGPMPSGENQTLPELPDLPEAQLPSLQLPDLPESSLGDLAGTGLDFPAKRGLSGHVDLPESSPPDMPSVQLPAPSASIETDMPQVAPDSQGVSRLPELPALPESAALDLPALPELGHSGELTKQLPSLPEVSHSDLPSLPELTPNDLAELPTLLFDTKDAGAAVRQELLAREYDKDTLPPGASLPDLPEVDLPSDLPELPNADMGPAGIPSPAEAVDTGSDLSEMTGILSRIHAGIKELVEAAQKPQVIQQSPGIRLPSGYKL